MRAFLVLSVVHSVTQLLLECIGDELTLPVNSLLPVVEASADDVLVKLPLVSIPQIKRIETRSMKHLSNQAVRFQIPAIPRQSIAARPARTYVEKTPENARRIYAHVDIDAPIEDVWNVLTDYHNLEKVIPNLRDNQVIQILDEESVSKPPSFDSAHPEDIQFQQLAKKMKGAILRQVSRSSVAGLNVISRVTLEVREWPQGLPDYDCGHKNGGNTNHKLIRHQFPRPVTISSLPRRDISLQRLEDDNGTYRVFKCLCRMQTLSSENGNPVTRLLYAVDVSPRLFVPVRLIEGVILRDVRTQLEAIRDFIVRSSRENKQ